jgi:glycosyltransferase involved in cell wall biosynthesis
VVPSAFLRNVFNKRNVQVEVVPNIIDLSRFFPGMRDKGRCHIVVTRNLEDIYDIPTALRAFALLRVQLSNARLTVAGSGPKLGELRALCDSLGIAGSVNFTGRLDNDRVADLYRNADLMLNSSLADNMPISLLEAMASGVPVVSTSVGGVPFLVEDGKDAVLVAPGDAKAMADAVLQILRDDELRSRLIREGIMTVKHFTWSEVRPVLFAVYMRAMNDAEMRVCPQ